ncbi:TetR family transcriptional regulator [Actinomadura vinacea]|uniref:TetR family transcriptional regulator n=1 Tax=Actinomadura vinacea TaxID=115336 RepID=A0ABP5XHK5_9ACTN
MIDAQYRGADPDEGGKRNTSGSTGSGTGRQERRERTRTALLGAAQQLWAEHGIHGASLDDIASAAGLTKGAVYSNFTGKTDLLLALLERWTSAGLGTETYAELGESGGSPEDRFERAGHAYAHRISGEGARLLALLLVEFWLYGMRDDAAGARISGWYAERRAGLAEHLHEVDGIAAPDRAALALALDFGLAMQHLVDPDRVPAELYSHGMRLVLGKALA